MVVRLNASMRLFILWWSSGFVLGCCECLLETANWFAQAFAEFGQFLWAKDYQRDRKNDQQMQWLEKSFKHLSSSNLISTYDAAASTPVALFDNFATGKSQERRFSLAFELKLAAKPSWESQCQPIL
jgi:hypothetical protein